MEGRAPARVVTLAEYTHEPEIVKHMQHTFPKTLTLYPDHEYKDNKWGMAIDLTSCTGCGACVVACVAENNIPVVGKAQVSAAARCTGSASTTTSTGDVESPETMQAVHQPVPCQQCENAPCEVVCPVAATDAQRRRPERHGLQPLRRHALLLEQLPVQGAALQLPALLGLEDRELLAAAQPGRHGPQPRRHGEVHLLRAAHQLGAHRRQEGQQPRHPRRRDRHGLRAVCPADAIVFGDLNDPESRVAKLKAQERNYGMLEELDTRPRTTYLAALRNPNPELEPATTGERTTGH